jgi:Toastrack DUF4097
MYSTNQNGEKKMYRVILLVAIGLAAFSSAMKELNQFQQLTLDAGNLIAQWSDIVVPTASARTPAKIDTCEAPKMVSQISERSDEFRWNGSVAQGQAIEIKGINGDIVAEPAAGGEVQVVALKKSRRSEINSVQLKVVQHAGGVTICALYPGEDDLNPNTCEPGEGKGRNSTRNNDVRVDFKVRVPYRVGFIGRTINGEISATSLTGNVVSKTINGGIRISTTGYAEASTINGEISARLGDSNWPDSVSFKTLNGGIVLDLPANASTDVDAKTMNGTITSDFPLNLTDFKNRKHVQGRIGVGGRELVLKTLNGSINLRIAS